MNKDQIKIVIGIFVLLLGITKCDNIQIDPGKILSSSDTYDYSVKYDLTEDVRLSIYGDIHDGFSVDALNIQFKSTEL